MVPSGFFALPPRQPTAASTLPVFSPVTPPGAMTTTSVTMLASKHGFTRFVLPEHGPVRSRTFENDRPPFVERYKPLPVAAYTTLGCPESIDSLKPNASSGMPVEWIQ